MIGVAPFGAARVASAAGWSRARGGVRAALAGRWGLDGQFLERTPILPQRKAGPASEQARARRSPGRGFIAPGSPYFTMTTDARLRALQDRFIASWGQMAGVWGISRTMAEVHALLYITGLPACTDDLMERLEISRGNASMSLRALVDWGVVTRTHRRGDRKEYFVAEQDVWAMFRAIVRERMKREVDPLLAVLYEIRESAPAPGKRDPEARRAATTDDAATLERLDALLEFFETAQALTQRFVSPAGRGLEIAATLLGKTTRRRSRSKATGVDADDR